MARRGGWKRLGRRRFRYVDSRERPITDEEDLERIRSLVIPPAWTDVWISPKPGAKLQAIGLDGAGRRQYIYHPSYRAAQERAKFDQLLDFAESLPALRARTSQDLRLGPYERDWACAIAVGLVNHGWFRVGSERHARASRTYGITTLTKRHVVVSGSELELRFRTKNKTLVRRKVENATLARALDALLDLENGARLFRFEQEGEIFNLRRRSSTTTSGSTSATDSRPRTSGPGEGRCSRPPSSQSTARPRARPTRSASSLG